MALTAPVAAKSFYENGLIGLIGAMNVGGGDAGQIGKIALLSALPSDIEAAWAFVGAGADGPGGGAVGSLVLGSADIVSISNVLEGDKENDPDEPGYKVTFAAINDVMIKTTGSAVALALLNGRDTFGAGSDSDVRYIVDLTDIDVTMDTSVNIPAFDIEIQFGTNKP